MPDQPEKLDLRSLDITAEKKQELLRLFPEIRTEDGRIDFERLRLALGELVDVGRERYGMNWPGKAESTHAGQLPSTGTLLPCPADSVNFDTSQNLIIEGDNLEVLKLLQKSYLGKVKMIYIDPPYNTGNDFIYPDNYSESLRTYLEYTGQVDAEGRRFNKNADTGGRFHSRWMNMMYPRLALARDLLKDDGVVFISIDDNEVDNLKKICCEIFGEENLLPPFVRRAKVGGGSDNKQIAKEVDYLLGCAKDINQLPVYSVPHTAQDLRRYSQKDDNGYYFWDTYSRSGLASEDDPESDSLYYDVVFPDGTKRTDRWRRSKERLEKDLSMGEAKYVETSNGWNIHFKQRLNIGGKRPRQILFDGFGNTEGSFDLESIWPDVNFSYPKPVSLIKYLMVICKTEKSIILDFFAGSGTTAQAVLELNQQDGGQRKFILVQLPEPTGREDYPTIADITKERVRRVIQKFNAAETGQLPLGTPQDRGFRVFKQAESNFKPWDGLSTDNAAALAQQLELHIEHIRPGRGPQDILYEILLKSGFMLTTPVEALTLAEKEVFSVAEGALLICLEHDLTLEVIRAIAARQPQRVVCLDAGFAGNDQLKANAVQIFKTAGVPSFKTV